MTKKEKWELELIADIDEYGIYRQGLTTEEIKYYLKIRARNTKLAKRTVTRLYRAFTDITGVNTMAIVTLENGTEEMLMYRHDVKRFSEVLFDSISTYWD